MDNVFVFAGVPRIMQGMLNNVLAQLATGPIRQSRSVVCNLGEGAVAAGLRELQERYPQVEIGSYPGSVVNDQFRLSLVVSSTDDESIEEVCSGITALVEKLGGQVAD